MTDQTTDSSPWPVPETSLIEGTELARAIDVLVECARDVLEPEAQTFIEDRPVKADPTHPVWMHDAARIIDALETVIDKVRETQGYLAEAFCHDLPYRTSLVAYADCRPIQPRWGGDRKKWRNDLLADDVKPRLLFDADGDLRDPKDVLDVTLSVVSLIGSNVKVTGLRALGLDPDDYSHSEKKPPTVQVVK